MKSKVKGFHELTFQEIYSNIDLKIYTKYFNLKYDIIVNPGGNTNEIEFINKPFSELNFLSIKVYLIFASITIIIIIHADIIYN